MYLKGRMDPKRKKYETQKPTSETRHLFTVFKEDVNL